MDWLFNKEKDLERVLPMTEFSTGDQLAKKLNNIGHHTTFTIEQSPNLTVTLLMEQLKVHKIMSRKKEHTA